MTRASHPATLSAARRLALAAALLCAVGWLLGRALPDEWLRVSAVPRALAYLSLAAAALAAPATAALAAADLRHARRRSTLPLLSPAPLRPTAVLAGLRARALLRCPLWLGVASLALFKLAYYAGAQSSSVEVADLAILTVVADCACAPFLFAVALECSLLAGLGAGTPPAAALRAVGLFLAGQVVVLPILYLMLVLGVGLIWPSLLLLVLCPPLGLSGPVWVLAFPLVYEAWLARRLRQTALERITSLR